MKRLGVQKSVLFVRDLTFSSIYSGFWSLITLLALWGAAYKSNMGLGVLLVFVFLNQAQSLLRTNLINNVLPNKYGIWIQGFYMLF